MELCEGNSDKAMRRYSQRDEGIQTKGQAL